ncbi:MAG: branched-chain amino acid ABC transporter substrate-binding protein [Solirubrobacteraceae bacterium]|nr:branched-chain amino acid ABC transporter substrate-binding protein [Solirubrobacteraceae bacterium]
MSLGLAACAGSAPAGDDSAGGTIGGKTLTIYSSLPLQGADRARSQAIVNGEKLALVERGGKIGGFTVKYVSLDDSTASAGMWDPGATLTNARKAVLDQTTIAYLGELDSLASAISIPLLNEAGILQVSPGSPYAGLTTSDGAEKGEPDKYYPTGRRTFGRVVPSDGAQAAAQAAYQRQEGCTRLHVLNDKEVEGKGLALGVAGAARTIGIAIAREDAFDPAASSFRDVGERVAASGADCVFAAMSSQQDAVRLWGALHAAAPAAKLFGSDRIAGPAFASGLGASEQAVTFLTEPTLGPGHYPSMEREMLRRYERRFGEPAPPDAARGYEAMSVVLDAIERAGARASVRQEVVDAFFATRSRDSVLGRYSIDADGDMALGRYGGYVVRRGELVLERVLGAATKG